MPRRATGRPRGRPGRNWSWWKSPPIDADWWALARMLMLIEDHPDEPIDVRPLARQALAACNFTDTRPIIITAVERKFLSLMEEAAEWLIVKEIPLTNKALIHEAQYILDECYVWHDVTPEEHRIIDAAEEIWEKILKREGGLTKRIKK